MGEINLLPDDFREEEKKQLEKTSSSPKTGPVFHLPGQNQSKNPLPPVTDGIKPAPKAPEISNSATRINLDDLLSEEKAAPVSRPVAPTPIKEAAKPKMPSLPQVKKDSGEIKSMKRKFSLGFIANLFKKNKGSNIITNLPVAGEEEIKNFNVNLIPEGVDFLPRRRLFYSFIITALLAFLLVGVASLVVAILNIGVVKQGQSLSTQLDKYQARVNKLKAAERDYDFWNQRIDLVKQLLGQHVYFTNIFTLLEKYTIPDVYYAGLNFSKDGSASMSATGANYLAVARQYKVLLLHPEIFNQVTISGLSYNDSDGSVRFTLNLLINPAILLKQ